MTTAYALDLSARSALLQHKHLLANIMRSWLAKRNNNEPIPKPIAISDSDRVIILCISCNNEHTKNIFTERVYYILNILKYRTMNLTDKRAKSDVPSY